MYLNTHRVTRFNQILGQVSLVVLTEKFPKMEKNVTVKMCGTAARVPSVIHTLIPDFAVFY